MSAERHSHNRYLDVLNQDPRRRSKHGRLRTKIGFDLIVLNTDDIRDVAEALKIAEEADAAAAASGADGTPPATRRVHVTCRGEALGPGGSSAVADLIRINSRSLESIDVGFNSFGDAGAKIVATDLSRNEYLRNLNLAGNNIGAEGAKALADAVIARAVRPRLRNVDAAHVRLLQRSARAGGGNDFQLIRALTGISLPISKKEQRILRDAAMEALQLWIARDLQTADVGVLPAAIEKTGTALGTYVIFEILRLVPDLFKDVRRVHFDIPAKTSLGTKGASSLREVLSDE